MKTIRASSKLAASRTTALRKGHKGHVRKGQVRKGQASAISRIDRMMMTNTNRLRVSQRNSCDAMWRVRALMR